MKIILLENVRKVGSIGDVIDVKRGFARNYLISKKKALFASKESNIVWKKITAANQNCILSLEPYTDIGKLLLFYCILQVL